MPIFHHLLSNHLGKITTFVLFSKLFPFPLFPIPDLHVKNRNKCNYVIEIQPNQTLLVLQKIRTVRVLIDKAKIEWVLFSPGSVLLYIYKTSSRSHLIKVEGVSLDGQFRIDLSILCNGKNPLVEDASHAEDTQMFSITFNFSHPKIVSTPNKLIIYDICIEI